MFSNFFIKRPIFAIVVSLVIVISGLISMFQLPIEQYPNMAPVQIMVTASYPGADAKTVAETVAAPIETQVNGVDNMIYMTSSASSTGDVYKRQSLKGADRSDPPPLSFSVRCEGDN